MENNNINTINTKKYLLPGKDMKVYEKDIMSTNGILAPCSVEFQGSDLIEKVYFDTVDRFFFSKGLLIYSVKHRSSNLNTIIVRQEGEDKRIPFIGYMPKTLTTKVSKKDFFSAHFDFIIDAIGKIMPAGLNVNVPSYINTIIPVFVVIKKARKFRIIYNNGLKMVLSFESVEYINNANKNRHRLNQLEVALENNANMDEFEKFIKKLILQVPTILPMKDSDILNGLDYTSMTTPSKTPIKGANKDNNKASK